MVHEEDKVVESKQEVIATHTPEPTVITTTTKTTTEITTQTTQVSESPVPVEGGDQAPPSEVPATMDTTSDTQPATTEATVEQPSAIIAADATSKALAPVAAAENLEGVNILYLVSVCVSQL